MPGDHRVRVDLPEALVALPQVVEKRHRVRLLLDLGLLQRPHSPSRADRRRALVVVDDRVGELVRLRLAPALEVVVERLPRLLHLRVVEHADREQEALARCSAAISSGVSGSVRTSLMSSPFA